MTLHLLSCDHRTHGLDAVALLGSAAACCGPDLLREVPDLRGALVLRTCNRLALLVDAPEEMPVEPLRDRVERFLLARALRAGSGARPTPEGHDRPAGPGGPAGSSGAPVRLSTWSGGDAHRELFATAAGLESMVVGEREIAGQLRRALTVASQDGTLTGDIARAVEHASSASRRVARETGLAGAGRSVVDVGIDLASPHLPALPAVRVLVVGTGAYAGATVSSLRRHGVTDIRVHSRSARAEAFARKRGLRAVPVQDLPRALGEADLVVTCRGLDAPVLSHGLVALALEGRAPGRGELVVLDLALARDVEESVRSLPGLRLIDLHAVQRGVPEAQASQVDAARAILDEELELYERVLSGRRMDPVVRTLRSHVDGVVAEEIARLPAGGVVEVEEAARALRRVAARLLHMPTVAARAAGEQGRAQDYLDALELVVGSSAVAAVHDEAARPGPLLVIGSDPSHRLRAGRSGAVVGVSGTEGA
ncbi:glutamyl-tRNA reductase [Actinomyces howellii]|uniref:Glutamyl-tRNA reductase n=1 Tax=Actinomyces howellii TaxID=52771 RepID=A0A448HI74_9ACTO|nr:glutamyl-tRNA reductase [Actinomyces howellii]VEG29112.1 Glutamyl-tRNA reductase [Actinomyces howellii]